jgi:DNA-binding PadR family transcriptional regulator
MFARDGRKGIKLAIFKRREARLNFAILQILTTKSSQTRYELYKQIKANGQQTRYSNVNYRIKSLEALGFVRKCGSKKTKTGLRTDLYEATARAYLALALTSLDFDKWIYELDDTSALAVLSIIMLR